MKLAVVALALLCVNSTETESKADASNSAMLGTSDTADWDFGLGAFTAGLENLVTGTFRTSAVQSAFDASGEERKTKLEALDAKSFKGSLWNEEHMKVLLKEKTKFMTYEMWAAAENSPNDKELREESKVEFKELEKTQKELESAIKELEKAKKSETKGKEASKKGKSSKKKMTWYEYWFNYNSCHMFAQHKVGEMPKYKIADEYKEAFKSEDDIAKIEKDCNENSTSKATYFVLLTALSACMLFLGV